MDSKSIDEIALKTLFFPTLTTIWDIEKLIKSAKITPRDVKEGNLDPGMNLSDLVLVSFKPIIRESEDKKGGLVTSSDIEYFLKSTEIITNKLKTLGLEIESKIFFYRALATLTYLISTYITWNLNLNNELKAFFGKGTFDDEAFEKLIDSVKKGFWLELAKKVNAENLVFLNAISYILSLEVVLRKADNRKVDQAKNKLSFIINLLPKSDLNTLLKSIIETSKKDDLSRRLLPIILGSILEVSMILNGETRISEIDLKDMQQIVLNEFLDMLANKDTSSQPPDYLEIIYKKIAESVKLYLNGSATDARKLLRELGKMILEWKLSKFDEFKILPLQLPPEMPAITIPKMRGFPVNLVDNFDPSRFMTLTNDILSSITNWAREVKSLLKFIIVNDVEKCIDFILDLIDDGFGFIGLQYIVGFPEIVLIETAIALILDESVNENKEKTAREILNSTNKILSNRLSKIKELLGSEFSDVEYIKNVIGYYSYRTVFFLSQRVHPPKIREKLEKYPEGKAILNILEEYSKINERIYGKVEEVKDVSDLFT